MVNVYMCPLPAGASPRFPPRKGFVFLPYVRQGCYKLPSGNLSVRDKARYYPSVPLPDGSGFPTLQELWALLKPRLLEDIRKRLAKFPGMDTVLCCFDLNPCVLINRAVCGIYLLAMRAEDFPNQFLQDGDDPEFTWTEELCWTKDGPGGWKFTMDLEA